ncbi:MAG: extracellular solute-binding protein [Ruminococcus sp.]|nr:extracellular solute-binding protein [Ruminococcus sp.]
MNRLKKILAGIMAMTCMLSTAACGPVKDPNGNKANNSSQVQEMMEKSYKAIEIEAELPITELNSITPIGDTGKILISGYATENDQYKPKAFITDYDFSVFEEIDLGLDASDSVFPDMKYVVTNSGKIFAVVTITDYGDFEMPDYNDPDFDYENFDYEAMEEAATTTYSIYTLDEAGNIITENPITGLEKYADDDFIEGQIYVGECFALGNDNVCLAISGSQKSTYVTVDAEGNLSEPLDFGDDEYFYPYGTDRDNNFVYLSYDGDDNVLKTLNADTMELSPDSVTLEDTSYFNYIIKGSGEYRAFLSGSTSLYGLMDDGTLVELINWIDSDLSSDYVTGLIPVDGGDFLMVENNWSTGETSVYRLTKRDSSEIENVQIINMVMEYSDQSVIEMIKEFNKTNGEYRIKVEDYNQYYEWDEESEKQTNSPEKQLKQDIAAGKDVDIICMGSSYSSLLSNLSRKGALVDFYDYLEKDEELSKDDFVPTILSVCETEGKLTSLASSFYISTLGCKSKYFDKENWTIDEFIETCRNLPEGMKPFKTGNTNTEIFSRFVYNSNDFIDYNNATCNFNSPEFIKVLEFCNEYPSAGEGDEIDWENATNEEMNAYWEESEVAIRNDKALLSEIYISNPRDYARAVHGEIGDDVTLVGNPSINGTGAMIYHSTAFAIMENSDYKDACWDFIKEIFSEENQNSETLYDLPALKSAFDKKLDESMERPYYTDSDGKKQEYDDTWYIGGEEIKINPLTQAERDFVADYISNAKPTPYYYNQDIYDIISEESEAYFAGDKTAEQTAEIIQNRVSILISEQS